MTAEQLSSIAGIVLSLIFTYIPGLRDRWDVLDGGVKQMFMGLMLILVAIGAFLLSCANVITGMVCDQEGAIGLLWTLIAALVANQSTYLITRKRTNTDGTTVIR